MRSAVMTYRAVGVSLAGLTLVAACAGPAVPVAGTPRSTTAAVVTAAPAGPSAVVSAPAQPAARPAFLSHTFTDVRDGKTFTLSDFAGRQVLVIGMAVW